MGVQSNGQMLSTVKTLVMSMRGAKVTLTSVQLRRAGLGVGAGRRLAHRASERDDISSSWSEDSAIWNEGFEPLDDVGLDLLAFGVEVFGCSIVNETSLLKDEF
jgi:hypothetical protein